MEEKLDSFGPDRSALLDETHPISTKGPVAEKTEERLGDRVTGGEVIDLLLFHRGVPPESSQHHFVLGQGQSRQRFHGELTAKVKGALKCLHLLVDVDSDSDLARQIGHRLFQPLVQIPGDCPKSILQRSIVVPVDAHPLRAPGHQCLHLLAIEAAQIEQRIVRQSHRGAGGVDSRAG